MAEDCPNPLLAQWMKERWDEARERNSKGALVYKKAHQSIMSCPLRFGHPSETQTLQGVGPKLADWLTKKMEDHCMANGLPRPTKKRSDAKRRAELAELTNSSEVPREEPRTKKARRKTEYVPKLRSGAYAIIMALSAPQADGRRGMLKNDIQREAQPFCDSSFTAPSDPTKIFTAWNSVTTLLNKELVCTVGRPVSKYLLTDEGWEIAEKIRSVEGNASTAPRRPQMKPSEPSTATRTTESPGVLHTGSVPTSAGVQNQPSVASDATSSPQPESLRAARLKHFETGHRRSELPGDRSHNDGDRFGPVPSGECTLATVSLSAFKPVCLPAGSFTIQIVLDNREVRTPADRDYISTELQKQHVTPIIRPLQLGDAIWIAKVNASYAGGLAQANSDDDGEGKDEVVLDYIMERKRLDDLIGSIKDGRFREQKFRLRKSGMKHVIYLIEEYSISAERSETYGDSLESAIASMQMINNFFVKQTSKLDETVRYLANMTRSLKQKYETCDLNVIPANALEGKTLQSLAEELQVKQPDLNYYITFSTFSRMSDKTDALTLRDVYLKMLMCLRGITGEKAVEIQKRWPTPNALIEAYGQRGGKEAKGNMISDQLSGLIPRKKVAKGLSTKLADVWA